MSCSSFVLFKLIFDFDLCSLFTQVKPFSKCMLILTIGAYITIIWHPGHQAVCVLCYIGPKSVVLCLVFTDHLRKKMDINGPSVRVLKILTCLGFYLLKTLVISLPKKF